MKKKYFRSDGILHKKFNIEMVKKSDRLRLEKCLENPAVQASRKY
jgi:hypothetical protein